MIRRIVRNHNYWPSNIVAQLLQKADESFSIHLPFETLELHVAPGTYRANHSNAKSVPGVPNYWSYSNLAPGSSTVGIRSNRGFVDKEYHSPSAPGLFTYAGIRFIEKCSHLFAVLFEALVLSSPSILYTRFS